MTIFKKMFLSMLMVSVIPLVIVFLYTASIYSSEYLMEIEEKRKLSQEGVVDKYYSFIEKIEFVSNSSYDKETQYLLKQQADTVSEEAQLESQLSNIFNVKLELFDTLKLIDYIAIDTVNGLRLEAFRNLELVFNKPEELPVDIIDIYKRQDVFVSENNEQTLFFARAINDLENIESQLAYTYIFFDVTHLDEIFKEYCDAFYSTVVVKNSFGDIIYLSDESFVVDEKTDEYNQYVFNSNNSSTTVIIYEDYNKIISPMGDLTDVMLMAFGFSFVFIIFAAGAITKGLVRPIHNLTKKVEKIEQGNYGVSVEIKGSKEIKVLSKAFNAMSSRIDYLLNERYKLELAKKEAIIGSLTEQINPHFLYNTLDMLKSMAELEDMYELSEIIKSIAHTFRYTTKIKQLEVTVEQELNHLKNYIVIMNARFNNKISITIDMLGDLTNEKMIKLCLQPLVENSINHGGFSENDVLEINVRIFSEGNRLLISVSDNGKGMSAEKLAKVKKSIEDDSFTDEVSDGHCGVGLKNINKRLKLFYGDNCDFIISSVEHQGTTVVVKIPI